MTKIIRVVSVIAIALAVFHLTARPAAAGQGAAQGTPPGTPPPAASQVTPPSPPLRVYLDCFECDTEFIRQNVVFIDYVRDRTDADLHVLVTTQGTGGGGTSWTVKFIALGRFQGQDRALTFTTPQSATSDDQRKEFARIFRLGLAGFAADTAVARELDLTFHPPSMTPAALAAAKKADPWHLWAFRVNGNVNLNGEQSSKFRSYRVSFSGSRVTEEWKTNVSVSSNTNESLFTLSDGHTVKSKSDSWNFSALTVNSVGPKFSVGGRISASHSSFSNTDRSISIYPGLEYNFFPYSENERRRFSIWWEAGPNFYDYNEITIFDKIEEMVIKQQMDISLQFRQPWGSLGIFSSFAQDLRNRDHYNASIFGDTEVRLFKGFSFNMFAEYARINDQISLPKEGATEEEILLRLQQLATNHRFFFSIGISYSFGSIFNSVVNPRYTGSGF